MTEVFTGFVTFHVLTVQVWLSPCHLPLPSPTLTCDECSHDFNSAAAPGVIVLAKLVEYNRLNLDYRVLIPRP